MIPVLSHLNVGCAVESQAIALSRVTEQEETQAWFIFLVFDC